MYECIFYKNIYRDENVMKEVIMARIKFLDVLEETKSKPLYKDQNIKESSSSTQVERPITDRAERIPRSGSEEMSNRMRRSIEIESPERNIRRMKDNVMEEDSSLVYDTGYTNRRSVGEHNTMTTPQASTNILGIDDNKYLWTGALFVLFGGVLFLSGFWLGKTITSRSKIEVDTVLSQNQKDFRREEINNTISVSNFPNTIQPSATTMETVPTTPKPIRVVEPASVTPKPTPVLKKAVVSSQNYAIQISAHSTIESARIVEDRLRVAGYSAYTSESVIGDAIFFRVRIRGFENKQQAQNTLAEIKTKGFGTDGFVLSLE